MNVRWSPTALRDIESVQAYIWRDNPTAAAATVGKILRGIEALVHQPAMGRKGRVGGTRELIIAPYVVAYRETKNVIELLAIIHSARRWPASF